MKISSSFDSRQRRRRSKAPLIWLALIILLGALLAVLWNAGGERPVKTVEKAIPADRLGK